MAKWDMSLVRDGRGVGEWLPGLVSEDAGERARAAEALGGMWQGKPRYSTKWEEMEGMASGVTPDMAGQTKRFEQAVREAVDAPGFPRATFVRKLLLYRMAQKRDWLRRVSQMSHQDETYDRRETELIERALTSPDEAERGRAAKRFGRLFCAALSRDQRLSDGAESMQPPGMVSYLVFNALGEPLLEASDLLREMLADRYEQSHALEALVRIGTKGRAFATDLLSVLDQARDDGGFYGAHAMAAVGRGDPEVVGELVRRLREGTPVVKSGAAATLEEMGTDVAGREGEIVDLLRPMLAGPETRYAGVGALASVGRDREDVMREVVELARPKEPRWKAVKQGKYEHRYDETMWDRGVAIHALRYFTRFPDQVVPVLADAVETFEEYDPDLQRGQSAHERVVNSLRAFGPAAAAAVPVLVRHVRQGDGEADMEVIRLLGDIGPGAGEALSALEELWRESGEERSAVWDEGEAPTREFDPVAWAIGRVRGEIE